MNLTRRELRLILLLAFLIGIALIQFATEHHQILWEHLGSAAIVSSILAFTIEGYLRSSLTEDAVRTAIGYVLPPEIRSEMEWFYGQSILCENHIQTVELVPIDNKESVEVKTTLRRTFRNVGASRSELPLDISVDEWFSPDGASQILSFGYKGADGVRHDLDVKTRKVAPNALSLATVEKVRLNPGETIEVWNSTLEVKHRNDRMTWLFTRPTKNPTVIVRPIPGFGISVFFDHREKGMAQVTIAEDTFRLNGVLLPFQSLHVQWWSKNDVDKWIGEAS